MQSPREDQIHLASVILYATVLIDTLSEQQRELPGVPLAQVPKDKIRDVMKSAADHATKNPPDELGFFVEDLGDSIAIGYKYYEAGNKTDPSS